MVNDNQVRILMKLLQSEYSNKTVAAKAGMDEKTVRKYERLGKLLSEIKHVHTWRTRPDPFENVWPEIRDKLALNPGLEAKTLFNYISNNTRNDIKKVNSELYRYESNAGVRWKVRPRKFSFHRNITPVSCANPILHT